MFSQKKVRNNFINYNSNAFIECKVARILLIKGGMIDSSSNYVFFLYVKEEKFPALLTSETVVTHKFYM